MSKYDRSRFTVLTAPFLHHTLEYGLDSIAANGFCGVELWGASPHFCLDDYDEAGRQARIREINAMLAARGLKMDVYYPEQIRQYPINIASPDPYLRDKSISYMRRCLEDAAAFSAERMMLAPGWAFVDSFSDDDTKRAIESVGMLAEYAGSLGVRLAMEEQEPIVSLLCSDLDKLSGIVNATGVEACMDIPLALSHGSSVAAYFDEFGKLGHVHLSDIGDGCCTALGTGTLDLPGLLSQLDEHSYRGKISLAFWGAVHYPDPDTPLRESRAWLRQHGIC
jgi:protein FrlC